LILPLAIAVHQGVYLLAVDHIDCMDAFFDENVIHQVNVLGIVPTRKGKSS
jgi:hypothetical protein